MKTRAPQVNAFTIITGSAGPVISHRLSCNHSGRSATFQSPGTRRPVPTSRSRGTGLPARSALAASRLA